MKKAVILFSGGLDSTTCLAIAKSQGFECYALSFDYNQKHLSEIDAAKQIALDANVKEHKIIQLPIGSITGSALTDSSVQVPDFVGDNKIPNTYVPARNTIFLSFALSWAEVLGANDIFIGANHLDYSGYPDCRPEYFSAFETLAHLATKVGVEGSQFHIHAPLLKMHKRDVIREGMRLGVDYGKTVSCYRLDANRRACGRCDSCVYRKKGFTEAGVIDPTAYQMV